MPSASLLVYGCRICRIRILSFRHWAGLLALRGAHVNAFQKSIHGVLIGILFCIDQPQLQALNPSSLTGRLLRPIDIEI